MIAGGKVLRGVVITQFPHSVRLYYDPGILAVDAYFLCHRHGGLKNHASRGYHYSFTGVNVVGRFFQIR